MANRIFYTIGLVFSFVLLITAFILSRFYRESHDLGQHVELLGGGNWYVRIDPSTLLREGILSPMLSNTLTAEERQFFSLPDARPGKLQETGINWLAPIYVSFHKINEHDALAIYLELSAPEEFEQYSRADTNQSIAYFNRGNRGVIFWSNGTSSRELNAYFHSHYRKASLSLVNSLTTDEPETLVRIAQSHSNEKPQLIRIFLSEDRTTLTLEGEITLHSPPLLPKLNQQKDALYLLSPLSKNIQNELLKRFELDSLLKNYLTDIEGIEMNYLGIAQHPTTKKPHPRMELALHTQTGEELLKKLSKLEYIALVNDSLIQIKDVFRGKYSVTDEGIWISSMKSSGAKPNQHPVYFELSGNPLAPLQIDEPYRSLAFALDSRLRILHDMLKELKPFNVVAESNGAGIMKIRGTYGFTSDKHVLFRSAYYLRQLVKEY
jgi:hypothetical protein